MAFSIRYGILYSMFLILIGIKSVHAVSVTLKSGANLTGQCDLSPHGEAINFLGIPYAKPPLGVLRFKPPQPHHEDWQDPLEALAYGATCLHQDQYRILFPNTEFSEDCLFINVHVPGASIDTSAPKAVMVGIHGGGLVFGNSQTYYGSNLAVLGDVIVVTMNYRLDIYGFLTSGSDAIPGNMGLMDQNLALQWVQNNIESFGGDKSRVTIFGESAGGWSVSLLVQSPMSKGLFQRAISMSGFATSESGFYYRQDLKDTAIGLARRINCEADDEEGLVECFQRASVDELNSLAMSYNDRAIPVVIDGVGGFVADHPDATLSKNRYNSVDYMAGVVQEDGAVGLWFLDEFDGAIKNGLGAASVKSLMDLLQWNSTVSGRSIKTLAMEMYFPDLSDPWSNLRGMMDLMTDYSFLAPTVKGLDFISTANPTYLYYFTQTGPDMVDIPEINFGPQHTEELPYLFRTVPIINATADVMGISRSMIHAWTTFAKTGKPQYIDSNDTSLDWPKYDTLNRKYLEFKAPMGPDSVKERLLSGRTSFFNNIVPALTDSSICEDDNPSLISRNDAETALFILLFVTISLVLAVVVILMNRTPAAPSKSAI